MSHLDDNRPDRLHSLDATRAFALLMGVLFHAAWSFQAIPWGAPVMDVSTNIGFDFYNFLIHNFRLPLFFLIAGFFARMLYQARGLKGFLRNRVTRIAVPLAVGWLVLQPLTILSWNLGANAAGANLSEFPVQLQLKMMLAQGLLFVPSSRGGFFNVGHLWFLYYLVWLYVLAFAARPIFLRLPALPARADRWTALLVRRVWPLLLLAVATGLFLWRREGWYGVETPTDTLVPSAPVLLFYMVPFSFGWMLHRQPVLLPEFARRWKIFTAAGLALSVVVFGVFCQMSTAGVVPGPEGSMYPNLWPTQVTDWPRFIGTLQSAARPGAPPALAAFWNHVPEWDRGPMLALAPHPAPSVKIGLCRNLTRLLAKPDLLGLGPAQDGEVRLNNRHQLEKIFAGAITGDPREIPWYSMAKLSFSMGFGLAMWLLVFGALGFFQARFSRPNPLLRYIADSSYWIYLIHLPPILALQGWMFDWPLPGIVKFLLLLVIFFAGAFGSYHFLVRPTFIGQTLNGRRRKGTPWRVADASA